MSEKSIQIKDKEFVPFITEEEISQSIARISNSIYQEYQNEIPVFVGVLSGVIMFFSDFLKHYPGPCEIAFLQVASYEGIKSTNKIDTKLDFTKDLNNRHVVILEDIIDTGNTLEHLYDRLENMPVASLKIATLLFKPEAFKKELNIDYIGMDIPNKFVVGYGLDYDGLGRNLKNIYRLKS